MFHNDCVWKLMTVITAANNAQRVTSDVQALFCRRRHQARRPPLAKIRQRGRFSHPTAIEGSVASLRLDDAARRQPHERHIRPRIQQPAQLRKPARYRSYLSNPNSKLLGSVGQTTICRLVASMAVAQQSADAVATSREGHRSPRSGRPIPHRRWGREQRREGTRSQRWCWRRRQRCWRRW